MSGGGRLGGMSESFGIGHLTRRPHPGLRGHVTSLTGYRDRPDPRAVHHGLPGPELTVILAFDEPIDVGWLADADVHRTYWAMASGLHLAPALVRPHGYQHGIQLGLTPLGARTLLGLPSGEIAGTLVELDSGVLGPALHGRLAAAEDWRTRLDLLESALLHQLSREERVPGPAQPELGEAWRLLRDHSVQDCAQRLGWTRRWLHRQFTAEFGIGPQQASRLFRFERAKRLADAGLPLAEVADRAGYADQPHLTREWGRLAGTTPTGWLSTPYPIAS